MRNFVDLSTSRLGQLLLSSQHLTKSQLEQALTFQSQRQVKLGTALASLNLVSRATINRTLKKQRLMRIFASSLALTPISGEVFASDNHSTNSAFFEISMPKQPTERVPPQSGSSLANVYLTDKPVFTERPIDNHSKDFYFSGDPDHLVALNNDFSEYAGIQFSLFNANKPLFKSHYEYQFEPQISLYSSSHTRNESHYSSRKPIGPGLDRASNTKPVIYMLTLKGRSIYHNSGKQTTMWSLDRAKKGVQRKAELMFSITKHF